MATKAYTSGNYFYLKLENTIEPLGDLKSKVVIWESNSTTNEFIISGPNLGTHSVLLSDLVDEFDTSYDATTWKTFFESNTGFDPATGGSVANSIVVDVFTVNDFGILDSTKIYRLNGSIDMGTTSLTVPTNGLNIRGYNFDVSSMFSIEDNYTLFVGENAGNLVLNDLSITTSGVDSKVFDLVDDNGFHALEINAVNFNDCTSLGELDSYRQGFISRSGFFGGFPDLTLTNTWVGGFFINTTIYRGLLNLAKPLFKSGDSFLMNSRFFLNVNLDLPTSASILDFTGGDFTNDSLLQITESIITRNGVKNTADTNLTPNITNDNLSSYWKGNQGLKNTFTGAKITLTTEVETPITQNVWTRVSGTYTASDLVHFSNPSTDEIRNDGSNPIENTVFLDYVVDGPSNNDLELRIIRFNAIDSSTDIISTQTRSVSNLVGGNDLAYFVIFESIDLLKDDYYYIEFRNTSGNGNITLKLDSFSKLGQK